ncbi:hypothetical protein SAMN06265365_105184 [Tistlia consotensis]|uniref:Uncharacterized protein n=1 Tax=Tistlia consotensis USBA 355 TaxID=560819 RepID=A0A1Y6BI72_9PROT|nr:hypothetical protein [Tistlia consotensis]SMF12858.1 hypothetical protein SAMN05428998_105114 [Tistlia consotensis USBA 355]SNR50868.1 hypothetical protein SAMN06265365_105184 [Tistlia consotensis]
MKRDPAVDSAEPAACGRSRDPVLAVSAGFLLLCLLLGLLAFVSPAARAFYEAGFAALYEAMAGLAAACQWAL